MIRLAALAACLTGGFLLFYAFAKTPVPRPANAPATAFSAGRAMADIAAMAPVPHPIGSAANHAVRDYLMRRMTALGIEPQVQRDESHAARDFGGETWAAGADVENIVGVLHGRDRAQPALTLMAHYDSVPGSPGAADDITSVAAILEIVRAVEAGGTPARDVMVVITDGEEAGLLGARAFFADHPLAGRAGFVLNLETRGGGGRASMFETGAGNGAAIDLLRRTAVRPLANALTVFVYRLLPNDTDYTVARKRGVFGFNYAFIGRQFDYHSPSSTVAALDQGSVQHIGDEVLGTARALALATNLPARTGDAVYGNLVGDWMVAYPPGWGWLVLVGALALAAVAVIRSRRVSAWPWTDMALGWGAGATLLVVGAILLDLARTATGVASGWMDYRPLLARFPLFEAGLAMVAVASLVLIGATTAMAARRDDRAAGIWSGLLTQGVVAGVVLQIIAPTIGFVIAWPTAAGAACAALTAGASGRRPIGWAAALVIVILTLAWLGGMFHSLLEGLDRADACAAVAWLAAMVALPLALPPAAWRRRQLAVGLVLLALGLSVMLWLHFTSPWSPRHPRAVMPLYVVDQASGEAWRAMPLPVDPWSGAVLRADGGAIERRVFPGFEKPLFAARARPVGEHAPPITVVRSADGMVTVRAPMAAGATLALDLRSDAPVAAVTAQGKPAAILAHPGRWTHLRWQAAPDGVTLAFRPLAPGRLDVRWAEYLDHWPTSAKPLPPMSRDLMAWDMAGSTVIVGQTRISWDRGAAPQTPR